MKTDIKQVQIDWEFIAKWYPNYHRCSDVLETDIIQRYIDGKIEDHSDDWDWVKTLGDDTDVILYLNSKSMALLDYAYDAYIAHKEKVIEYDIPLMKVSYSFKTLKVKADNLNEAQRIALSMASDFEYTKTHIEYKIDDM